MGWDVTAPSSAAYADTKCESQQTPFQNGEIILDRFRILRPIGKGGMGEVYEAEDLQLGKIALKTVHHEVGLSESVLHQFRQEIQLARRVSGTQVCRIHDLFVVPARGTRPAIPFLTMEYLDGVTLSHRLREDGPFPWKQALPIALEICAGLRLIHEKGIIHRDLKCANIMLCERNGSTRVVLMDFGLASKAHASKVFNNGASFDADAASGSSQGVLAGTVQYMAPEQFEAKSLTSSADIYALGIVLYELVTARHPFSAHTPLAAAIRRAKTLAPPSSIGIHVPRHWDRIIAKCLEFEPKQRFASAAEVAKALSAGPANIDNIRKDRPWVIWLAVTVIVVAGLAMAYRGWRDHQYYRPSAQALHWYNTGLEAIREGTYVKATHSLKEAIDEDPKFVMAHVRLAEAWENLDFETDAQQEMLLATPGERTLFPLDHLYLEAIRLTISHDFPGAIDQYKRIFNKLPNQEKTNGYVDLGKAYERSGDSVHALESYAEASKLDSQSAASCLRTAVLQSRLNHGRDADAAFLHAEKLFKAESNQEGLAELDFQRGYTYNDRSDPVHAKIFLQRALDEAPALENIQLEIRAHTQLSSAASASGHPEEGVIQAQQAIGLARDNRLDQWAADGYSRLAGAYIHQGKLPEAEEAAREALRLATRTGQLRAQALANLNLASIMDQQHKPDEIIAPAQVALDFYKTHGFFKPAEAAATLLVRAQRDKGQYAEALKSALALLEVASTSGDRQQQFLAEESLGRVYAKLEDFPNALAHFERELPFAESAGDRVWQKRNTADTLQALGRYSEADALLRSIDKASMPDNPAERSIAAANQVSALLSLTRYQQGLELARETLASDPKMEATEKQDLEIYGATALAHLGQRAAALDTLQHATGPPRPAEVWYRQLSFAEVHFYVGMPSEAQGEAREAAEHFVANGQLVSAIKAFALAIAASKALGDTSSFDGLSKKLVDTEARLEQNWGAQTYQTFLLRPDLQAAMQTIAKPGPVNRR